MNPDNIPRSRRRVSLPKRTVLFSISNKSIATKIKDELVEYFINYRFFSIDTMGEVHSVVYVGNNGNIALFKAFIAGLMCN